MAEEDRPNISKVLIDFCGLDTFTKRAQGIFSFFLETVGLCILPYLAEIACHIKRSEK